MSGAANFEYLLNLTCLLHFQYATRSEKMHFISSFIFWARANAKEGKERLPDVPFSEPPIAIGMDQNCRKLDGFAEMSTVDKYRAYYVHDKLFATWKTPDMIPDWFIEGRNRAGIPLTPTRRTTRKT